MKQKLIQIIRTTISSFDVIDWFIVSVAFLGLFVVLLVFRREVRFVTARFKVTDREVLYATTSPTNEYADSFRVGDEEKSDFGQTIARLVSVQTFNVDPDHKAVYLDVEVKSVYNPKRRQYSFKGKPLVAGQFFTFNLSSTYFIGVVVASPEETKKEQPYGTATVKARLQRDSREFSDVYGVQKPIAFEVKPGDEVKDSLGTVLATIIDVDTTPAVRTVVAASGRAIQVTDPDLWDVYYTIALRTRTIGGRRYMFEYVPLLVGHTIPVNLPTVSVFPTITEVLD